MEEGAKMSNVNFMGFTVFSSIIGSCGVILNLIVCLLYIRNTSLLDATNIFVFNIAIGDLLYSIVALPMLVMSNARGKWVFGEAGCTAYGFSMTFFALGSMMHLVGAAYERYFTLVKLFNDGEIQFSRTKAMRLSLILWCYSLFWSLLPLLGLSGYVQEGIGTSCSVNWRSTKAIDVTYVLFLMVACFVLPVTVIIYCYYKSYKSMCQLTELSRQNWGNSSPITRDTAEAECRMVVVTVVVTVAYLVAWTPYAIVALVSMFASHLVSDIGASIPAYIAKSSACYNPIIYVFFYKKLRDKFMKMFCCKKPQVRPQSVATDKPTNRNTDRGEAQNRPSSRGEATGAEQSNLERMEVEMEVIAPTPPLHSA